MVIHHRPGPMNTVADALSRAPLTVEDVSGTASGPFYAPSVGPGPRFAEEGETTDPSALTCVPAGDEGHKMNPASEEWRPCDDTPLVVAAALAFGARPGEEVEGESGLGERRHVVPADMDCQDWRKGSSKKWYDGRC